MVAPVLSIYKVISLLLKNVCI
ncbi:hypothetical protein VCHENC02_4881A, partial [Vibrio harveyi]